MSTGAVQSPASEIVPQPDFEQPGPETLHVTDVSEIPSPEAESCNVEPAGARTSAYGEILIGEISGESWLAQG